MPSTANPCHACKEDLEKKNQPLRELLAYALEPYTYTPLEKPNSDLPVRDTRIALFLCPYCDSHTIRARAKN